VDFQSAGDLTGQWDAARLRQVLSNLVGNAIEHGDEHGAIEVRAGSDGPKVLLTVTNHGTLIAPSALPTLFDPFVRATSLPGSSRRRGGIGLGLYIAREIVTAHGGTISVASSEATGTVFTVCLPRHHEKETRARKE
jgi:signal transduction histidine kinase